MNKIYLSKNLCTSKLLLGDGVSILFLIPPSEYNPWTLFIKHKKNPLKRKQKCRDLRTEGTTQG